MDKYGKDAIAGAHDRNLKSIVDFFQSLNSVEGGKDPRKRMSYPAFGVDFKFEALFDGRKRDPMMSKAVKLTEGSYYPFNSLKGSYLLDAIGIERISSDN